MTSRALVLGGGGHTGFAWQWGLLTGLHDAGVDLTAADVIVGTSAGSMAAAHLASGVSPQELLDTMMAPDRKTEARVAPSTDPFTETLIRLIKSGSTAAEIRAGIGAMALDTPAGSEVELRQIAAKYLPTPDWPSQRLLITAVDAMSGELAVFSRDSGVALVDAVAASCAVPGVWSPVTIRANRYIDAIIRSPTNADLAAGCDRVVVLAPMREIRGFPDGGLDELLAPVRAAGQVVVVSPDEASKAAIGRDQQDQSRQPAAARASLEQAKSLVDELAELWRI